MALMHDAVTLRIALRTSSKLLPGKLLFALLLATLVARPQTAENPRWVAEAARVTIVRDDWGIAHVHGATDADAVFGMIYAQCEDDFNRIEMNYLAALGRTAEAEGEQALWTDLRQRLFINPDELKKKYAAAPEWLRKLMDAWADGINFYLSVHKDVVPRVLNRFEPWMALSFTEGSIGGDIEKIDLKKLADAQAHESEVLRPGEMAEYMGASAPSEHAANKLLDEDLALKEPGGSNGFAIAPSNTRNHRALLLINPHTSFFFRSELQMTSDEGLNAYGAVTWGQFFVYQGFNERAGWMHTSSNVDAVDEFIEIIRTDAGETKSVFGTKLLPTSTKRIDLTYKNDKGLERRSFIALYTNHGPVVSFANGHFISVRLMNLPVEALEQSYLRTRATNYAEYRKTMELRANSSNNTVFADADGDIAYWHGNFIPKRDAKLDYTKPVDGSDTEADWHGLMTIDEIPHLINPASGYLFNVNDSPWNGAGPSSLKKADYPAYVEQGIETARGVHAMRVLAGKQSFTLDSLILAAYDTYLPWFARTIAPLTKAWDALPQDAPLKVALAQQIGLLRGWDNRWDADSVATSLAVYWGTELMRTNGAPAREAKIPSEEYIATNVAPEQLLQSLAIASQKLMADFGSWQTPWGQINRFQRLTGDIAQPFDDTRPSIPVPFTSSLWGSLASFSARQYPGTKEWYGTGGNSFVAVVEFGSKVRAKAVTAGGESGHPSSKHFNDEAQRYAAGSLRDVYFYPEQLRGHTEKTYHPGE